MKEIISLAGHHAFFAERRLVLIDGSGFLKAVRRRSLALYPVGVYMYGVCGNRGRQENKLYKKVKDNRYAAELKQTRIQLCAGQRGSS